jgi:hypothetical protein
MAPNIISLGSTIPSHQAGFVALFESRECHAGEDFPYFHSASSPAICKPFGHLEVFPTVGHRGLRGIATLIGGTEALCFLGERRLDESGVCRLLYSLAGSRLSTMSRGISSTRTQKEPYQIRKSTQLRFCYVPATSFQVRIWTQVRPWLKIRLAWTTSQTHRCRSWYFDIGSS